LYSLQNFCARLKRIRDEQENNKGKKRIHEQAFEKETKYKWKLGQKKKQQKMNDIRREKGRIKVEKQYAKKASFQSHLS
jgi:hypothetical protein